MAEATKVLREGSALKRAAILLAARELFMADGFERTSVDAIAARAAVSKRTVYDYFGDKRALLLEVVEDSGRTLLEEIRVALDETLATVASADALEAALIDFVSQLGSATIRTSADYGAVTRLVAVEAPNLPNLEAHWLSNEPEDLIGRRFDELAAAGYLEFDDQRRTVNHFAGLTFLQMRSGADADRSARELREDPEIIEGVRAFLRAYGPVRRRP